MSVFSAKKTIKIFSAVMMIEKSSMLARKSYQYDYFR